MLHARCNMNFSGNILARDGLQVLESRLPQGWVVRTVRNGAGTAGEFDADATLTSPDRRTAVLVIEARERIEPNRVRVLIDTWRGAEQRGVPMLVARYLSRRSRTLLRAAGASYLDLSGNVRLVVSEPGLFIETDGADADPDRQERPARTLSGPKAGRIVRALVDHRQPPGVRELASITKLDPGYVSRVLTLLDKEALIGRRPRRARRAAGGAPLPPAAVVRTERSAQRARAMSSGPEVLIARDSAADRTPLALTVSASFIQWVDWPALLRRWALDAPLASRGQTIMYLEPRGLAALVSRLAGATEPYAVSGGLAAAAIAPLAPPRMALVWMRDAAMAASRLGLRPTDAGANVMLIEPADDVVFEGAVRRGGVWHAAPSQVVADLITSPGRGPAEAEELIGWMQANEGAWRR